MNEIQALAPSAARADPACPASRHRAMRRLRREIERAHSIADLRLLARRRLPRSIFDFIDGGAEDELTLNENRESFRRMRLVPKILADVARVDISTDILGMRSALPIMIAPTGAAGLGWPGADVAIARAAAHHGIPYTLSSSATASIERIASEAGGNLLFQAYIMKDREVTRKLIGRARVAGYSGLMITVDTSVGGNRERDYRNDFAIPFRLTLRNLTDFLCHPRWIARILLKGVPRFENLTGLANSGSAVRAASSVGRNLDASFNWEDLKAIRDLWPGKLVIKGVLRPEDTEALNVIGCDAVVVSNHGGRQLDGSMSSLEALPGIASVRGGMSVLIDSGIRRGSDIVKALALGADAVLVGRATLYGVCAGGESGAGRALSILSEELTRTMQLCGVRSLQEINRDILGF